VRFWGTARGTHSRPYRCRCTGCKISERLQLDRELTLAKAVTVIRQAEQVHQQQGLLRAPTTSQASCEVNAIKTTRQHTSTENYQSREPHRQHKTSKPPEGQATCKWCGRKMHDRQQCPAREAICRNCKKTGHYEKVCRSDKKTVRAISTMDTLFLDTVSDDKRVNAWQADVSVNHKLVKFRLNTGADATVLPAETYSRLFQRPLSSADKLLCGPNRPQLDVIGRFDAQLQWPDRLITQTVYVVRDIHQPLLQSVVNTSSRSSVEHTTRQNVMLNFMIDNCIPVSLAGHKSFKRFRSAMDPDFQVSGDKFVVTSALMHHTASFSGNI
jgi:hypothetical protein